MKSIALGIILGGLSINATAVCTADDKPYRIGETISIMEPDFHKLKEYEQKLYKDSYSVVLVCTPSFSATRLLTSESWSSRKLPATRDVWVFSDVTFKHQTVAFDYSAKP
jgi:hypothetical protein